jgi:hypothetical protein
MKQVATFEGWLDTEPGWEFDMPVFMVSPIMGYMEAGNDGGIDYLIEEYFITLFMEEDENGKAIGSLDEYPYQVEEDWIRRIKINFNNAKKGKSRNGISYWRRVVEWDDQDISYQKILEDIRITKSE